MVYGIDVVPAYKSLIIVEYLSSNIASYSREMCEKLYLATVSLQHKISFSKDVNLSLTTKSSKDIRNA